MRLKFLEVMHLWRSNFQFSLLQTTGEKAGGAEEPGDLGVRSQAAPPGGAVALCSVCNFPPAWRNVARRALGAAVRYGPCFIVFTFQFRTVNSFSSE